MIKGNQLCLTYPDGTVALKGIDLEIQQGELVYLIGPSGSGKTSLLKLLMGIEVPTSGTLEIMGAPLPKGKALEKFRQAIGPVFQEFKLIDGRNALENVMLGMRFLDLPLKEIQSRSLTALAQVGLEAKTFSLVEHLSWGERQRVAIARAVARKPKIILADEPTGNLDTANGQSILALLESFRDYKTTVLITTHATHLINPESNCRILEMNRGILSSRKEALSDAKAIG